MSIGPLGGIVGSLAGTPMSQTRGSEQAKAAQDAKAQERRATADAHATDAAGVGRADGEGHESHDRDADGRMPWERPAERKGPEVADESPAEDTPAAKDPAGEAGTTLDLSA